MTLAELERELEEVQRQLAEAWRVAYVLNDKRMDLAQRIGRRKLRMLSPSARGDGLNHHGG